MSAFDDAFQAVIGVEKGYVVDQGGPTMYGVTEAVARRHGYKGDMRDLPLETAKGIYQNDYWNAAYCGEMPWPLAKFVFDSAVNQGAGTAIRLLQEALGVGADGMFGPRSQTALRNADHHLAARFMALRALRYVTTKGFSTDGKGWFKRLFVIAIGNQGV